MEKTCTNFFGKSIHSPLFRVDRQFAWSILDSDGFFSMKSDEMCVRWVPSWTHAMIAFWKEPHNTRTISVASLLKQYIVSPGDGWTAFRFLDWKWRMLKAGCHILVAKGAMCWHLWVTNDTVYSWKDYFGKWMIRNKPQTLLSPCLLPGWKDFTGQMRDFPPMTCQATYAKRCDGIWIDLPRKPCKLANQADIAKWFSLPLCQEDFFHDNSIPEHEWFICANDDCESTRG